MKLLLVGGRLDVGDSHWPLASLLDRLERRQFEVQVLRLFKGVDLRGDPRVSEAPVLAKRWLRTIALRRLWSDGWLQPPDLLHVVHDALDSVALSLSESGGFPYIQSLSSFATIDRGLRLSRRWCRGLIATGPDLASDLVETLRIPPSRISVILPGVSVHPGAERQPVPSNVPVIGTGGAKDEISGLLVFLAAARQILDTGHDVEFVVGGHGNEQTVLRHHAHRLGIADRVTVADHAAIGGALWPVSDIFCHPAVGAASAGMLLHALAHGIPCVATNVKGLRLLIDHGRTGLIVPPADPAALAHAIISLLNNPAEARRLGQRALETARTLFDPEREADCLADLYRQAASHTHAQTWTRPTHSVAPR